MPMNLSGLRGGACTGSGWIIPIGMPTIGVMPIAIVGVGGCT